MIDKEGFRKGVGVVLANRYGRLFWAKRIGQDAWQFPQGGLDESESAVDGLYRELWEEVGLEASDVEIIAETKQWLSYRIPQHLLRHHRHPLCIGQKQKWFLLRLIASDQKVRLDLSDTPEFDSWQWVPYWQPKYEVIRFKRQLYQEFLTEFNPYIV